MPRSKYIPIYNEVGEKKCEKCSSFLSIEKFTNSPFSPDGKIHVCHSCRYPNAKMTHVISGSGKNKCRRCKAVKDEGAFELVNESKSSVCKECLASKPAANRAYRARKRVRGGYYTNLRLSKYGLTLEQYKDLVTSQENKCKICDNEFIKNNNNHKNPINIDHCHTTGKVRGLLCNACNTALGSFKDNIQYLTNAIKYLTGL